MPSRRKSPPESENKPRLQAVVKTLEAILTNDEIKVAALKGNWGVGKTFQWKQFIEKRKGKLPFEAYSYISLFGIGSIDELRRAIIKNAQFQKKTNVRQAAKASSALELLKLENPLIDFSRLTDGVRLLIEMSSIRNFLICIDDIERREESLPASALLGLISMLKEEKDCKVLLIYNENELQGEGRARMEEYREKVIDIEVTFEPTVEENTKIVWWDQPCPPEMKKVFIAQGITNIRVLRKAKQLIRDFEKELNGSYPWYLSFMHERIAKLVIIYCLHGRSATLREISTMSHYDMYTKIKDEKDTRLSFLKGLDYMIAEQDAPIIDYLLNGWTDLDDHQEILTSKEKALRAGNLAQCYQAIWEQYHFSLRLTGAQFSDSLRNFFLKNWQEIGIYQLAESIEMLDSIEEPTDDLRSLLDKSAELFAEKTKDRRFDQIHLSSISRFPEVTKIIAEKLAAKSSRYSLGELFQKLGNDDSWNSGDFALIATYSTDDILHWLQSGDTSKAVPLLRNFLARFNGKADERAFNKHVREALDLFAGDDRYRRMQLKNLIYPKNETLALDQEDPSITP